MPQFGEDEYWIAVDFDGTLAEYNGFKGHELENLGKPIQPMVNKVLEGIESGAMFAIFTARAYSDDARHSIGRWLIEAGLPIIQITNIKEPKFKEFWDDRAHHVHKNKGVFLDHDSKIEKDTGAHYRYQYKGVKLDPARIFQIYECGHPMAQAIVKKALCAGNRGKKNIMEDIDDIICAAQRWKEMLLEDSDES